MSAKKNSDSINLHLAPVNVQVCNESWWKCEKTLKCYTKTTLESVEVLKSAKNSQFCIHIQCNPSEIDDQSVQYLKLTLNLDKPR